MANGPEHSEHLRRGDSLRSSVSQNQRRSSVKNGLLDPVNRRPLYRHGRCVDAAKEWDLCLLAELPVRSRRRCWFKLQQIDTWVLLEIMSGWFVCLSVLFVCRRDSRDRNLRERSWRNGDMGAYGEQGNYSREEDNESIPSRDRYDRTRRHQILEWTWSNVQLTHIGLFLSHLQ